MAVSEGSLSSRISLMSREEQQAATEERNKKLKDIVLSTPSSQEHEDARLTEQSNIYFIPPLYEQRYQEIARIAKECQPKKVVDIGCGELRVVRLLKFHESIHELIGMDCDAEILRQHRHLISPLPSCYLYPLPHPFIIMLLHGSIAQRDCRLLGCDLAVCVEVIEHLYPDDVAEATRVIFGFMQPTKAVFTTPNAEFNVLFPGMKKFRHHDHKFEWTRAEFQAWGDAICGEYGYTVQYSGLGAGPEGSEHLGFCTQIAIFARHSTSFPEMTPSGLQPYSVVAREAYPYRIPEENLEEDILQEVRYRMGQLLKDARWMLDEEMGVFDDACQDDGADGAIKRWISANTVLRADQVDDHGGKDGNWGKGNRRDDIGSRKELEPNERAIKPMRNENMVPNDQTGGDCDTPEIIGIGRECRNCANDRGRELEVGTVKQGVAATGLDSDCEEGDNEGCRYHGNVDGQEQDARPATQSVVDGGVGGAVKQGQRVLADDIGQEDGGDRNTNHGTIDIPGSGSQGTENDMESFCSASGSIAEIAKAECGTCGQQGACQNARLPSCQAVCNDPSGAISSRPKGLSTLNAPSDVTCDFNTQQSQTKPKKECEVSIVNGAVDIEAYASALRARADGFRRREDFSPCREECKTFYDHWERGCGGTTSVQELDREELRVRIPLHRLLRFPILQQKCCDMNKLREVLQATNFFQLSRDGAAIICKLDDVESDSEAWSVAESEEDLEDSNSHYFVHQEVQQEEECWD